MGKKIIYTLSIVIGYWFLVIGYSKVYAQEISLSLSPPEVEVFIKPGKSITQSYKITNNGETIVVIPKLANLDSVGLIKDTQNPEKWITVLNTDLAFDRPFLMSPNQSRQLIVRVNPPVGVEEKDYYKAILFTTRTNPPTDTSQSAISQTLASPLLITISSTGLLTKAAQITQFTVPRLIDSFDPLNIDIFVKNTGKTFFRPVGKINLAGMVGKGSFDIEPYIILADQTRMLVAQNQNLGTNTLALNGFFMGKYTIEADFTLDAGANQIRQSKTFYAFPWKMGMLMLITIIIAIKVIKKKK